MDAVTIRDFLHFFQVHQTPGTTSNATYIHLGRSTSAPRSAAFSPTYPAAPKTIRNRAFIHPKLGIAQFFISNLILLKDRNKMFILSLKGR